MFHRLAMARLSDAGVELELVLRPISVAVLAVAEDVLPRRTIWVGPRLRQHDGVRWFRQRDQVFALVFGPSRRQRDERQRRGDLAPFKPTHFGGAGTGQH